MPAVIFMLVNSEMANLTDKEPIPMPMVMFMWVNSGMTNVTGKELIPLQTVESIMEFGTTANS